MKSADFSFARDSVINANCYLPRPSPADLLIPL